MAHRTSQIANSIIAVCALALLFSFVPQAARAQTSCDCTCAGVGGQAKGVVANQAACDTACSPRSGLCATQPTPTPSSGGGRCQCPGDSTPGAVTCQNDANCSTPCQGRAGTCVGGTGGGAAGGGGGGGGGAAGKLENPLAGLCKGLEGQACVQTVIGNIIKTALGIVGSLALLMMVYGGFLWLTSAGNSERIEKGKTVLIWAVIGLAVIFAGYTLTSFIITGLAGK